MAGGFAATRRMDDFEAKRLSGRRSCWRASGARGREVAPGLRGWCAVRPATPRWAWLIEPLDQEGSGRAGVADEAVPRRFRMLFAGKRPEPCSSSLPAESRAAMTGTTRAGPRHLRLLTGGPRLSSAPDQGAGRLSSCNRFIARVKAAAGGLGFRAEGPGPAGRTSWSHRGGSRPPTDPDGTLARETGGESPAARPPPTFCPPPRSTGPTTTTEAVNPLGASSGDDRRFHSRRPSTARPGG